MRPHDIADQTLRDTALPLLRLVRHLTGLETSFITSIDWEAQTQDVLVSVNEGTIEIAEGSRVEWSRSACRAMFLSGRWETTGDDSILPEAGRAVNRVCGLAGLLAP